MKEKIIMKGIMFNEHYWLESATLNGKKSRTSRIIKLPKTIFGKKVYGYHINWNPFMLQDLIYLKDTDRDIPGGIIYSSYDINEVVAIKQSYNIALSHNDRGYIDRYKNEPGWTNKMFVRNDLMPHHIKITQIKVKKLQDISDEDCIKEGIRIGTGPYDKDKYYFDTDKRYLYYTPRKAFAALIDKISGKGTWNSNPLIWVYYYDLVD